MTRKTYYAVARTIRLQYEEAVRRNRRGAVAVTLEELVMNLADAFAEDNDRFDPQRFYEAALGWKLNIAP